MRRLSLALLLLAAIACGGGGDPGAPEAPPANNEPPPPTNVTSGTFDVTATLQVNGCAQSTVWTGTYDVELDSLSFSMGTWTGSWNPTKATAFGESVKLRTTTRFCTVTRWSTVNLKFTTPDHFGGSVIYRLRLAGDCGDRSTCNTSWMIVGNRVQP